MRATSTARIEMLPSESAQTLNTLLAALQRVAGDLNAPGGDSISANTEAAVRAAIAACEVQS